MGASENLKFPSACFQSRSEVRALRPSACESPFAVVGRRRGAGEPRGADGAEAARPRPHDRPQGRHLQLRPSGQQTRESSSRLNVRSRCKCTTLRPKCVWSTGAGLRRLSHNCIKQGDTGGLQNTADQGWHCITLA